MIKGESIMAVINRERDEYGYLDTRITQAGVELGLMPLAFTIAICVDVNRDPLGLPYKYRFCYPKERTIEAVELYSRWDGLGVPSGKWTKVKGAGIDCPNPLDKDRVDMSEYVPDYNQECEVCGESPTVMIAENDQIQHDFNLCGVCCFGTAKAIDVDWWNLQDDD